MSGSALAGRWTGLPGRPPAPIWWSSGCCGRTSTPGSSSRPAGRRTERLRTLVREATGTVVARDAGITVKPISRAEAERAITRGVRVRPGERPGEGHRGPQGHRHAGDGRPVPGGCTQGGGGAPGDRPRGRAGGRGLPPAGDGPRELRRARHADDVRGHPLGHRRRADRRPGVGARGQLRGWVRGVRARARLGAETRGPGSRQPDRGDPLRRDDARITSARSRRAAG